MHSPPATTLVVHLAAPLQTWATATLAVKPCSVDGLRTSLRRGTESFIRRPRVDRGEEAAWLRASTLTENGVIPSAYRKRVVTLFWVARGYDVELVE